MVNLEFVSANPTGPVHIGGARWAAVGDALGRILSAQGAAVTREYYFNDAGAQIDRFARSLLAAARDLPAPDDGYSGDYIADIAAAVVAAAPDAPEPARRRGHRGVPGHRRQPDVRRDQGDPARLPHRLRRLLPRGLAARLRGGGRRRSSGSRSPATCTPPTVPGGCGRPTTATTRTGWSSSPTASRPTSPATSPTSWTSGPAVSTCASTCSAPTTTATSPGSRPPPPRWATTRTRSRC